MKLRDNKNIVMKTVSYNKSKYKKFLINENLKYINEKTLLEDIKNKKVL